MTGTHQLPKANEIDDALLRSLISTNLKEILAARDTKWVINNTVDILKQIAYDNNVLAEIDVTWYERG